MDWREADAEALPFADGEFDVVLSCVGVMFAPHHQAAADELTRVCRPGGTIGLLSWTPEGFIGQMLATMKPYSPPPPPGAQPPPLWGNEDHVRTLFGERITDVQSDARRSRLTTSRTLRRFVTISRAITVRPSPPIGASQTIPTEWLRWTATWPNSRNATTEAPKPPLWTGSTYSSPPALAFDEGSDCQSPKGASYRMSGALFGEEC